MNYSKSIIEEQRQDLKNKLNVADEILSATVKIYKNVCSDEIAKSRLLLLSDNKDYNAHESALYDYEAWCLQSVWIDEFVKQHNIDLKSDEQDGAGQKR